MKMRVFVVTLLLVSSGIARSQNLPAHITKKDGQSVNIYDFAQLDCSGNAIFDNYILIKGKYNNIITELKNYDDISRIDLIGFKEPPIKTGENEKGEIVITKKSGVVVKLEEATIGLSCYGVSEKLNQLQFQIINPLTERPAEIQIDTKDIQSIEFN